MYHDSTRIIKVNDRQDIVHMNVKDIGSIFVLFTGYE
jgi:hypothetical protein